MRDALSLALRVARRATVLSRVAATPTRFSERPQHGCHRSFPSPSTAFRPALQYDLTSMYMFRSWGGYTINVSIGMDPFPPYAKEFQFDVGPGTAFGSAVGWVSITFPVPVRARYVVAQPTGPCGGSWRELVFYGRLFSVAAPSPLPSPVPAPPRPQLKMLLGANDFCWVKMENMSAIGALREYNDWSFNERAPGVLLYASYAPRMFGLLSVVSDPSPCQRCFCPSFDAGANRWNGNNVGYDQVWTASCAVPAVA